MPPAQPRILKSGAPLGGVGAAGLPGVAPAVANALAVLAGRRIRSLPFAKARLSPACDAAGAAPWRACRCSPILVA